MESEFAFTSDILSHLIYATDRVPIVDQLDIVREDLNSEHEVNSLS